MSDVFVIGSSYTSKNHWIALLRTASAEYGEGVAITAGGDIYVVGQAVNDNACIVKLNSFGVLQWQKTLDSTDFDIFNSVAVDSSDNAYAVGNAYNSTSGTYGCLIAKYSPSGAIQWQRLFNGTSADSGAFGVAVSASGSVYVTGEADNGGGGQGWDALLCKYDTNGSLQWQRFLGGGADDFAYAIALDSSENVYVCGQTASSGGAGNNVFYAKYNSAGSLQWQQTFSSASNDAAYGIAVDPSGTNVYISGFTSVFSANQECFVACVSASTGAQVWQRALVGTNNVFGASIAVDASGNAYVSGPTNASGGTSGDAFVVCYSSSGTLVWQRFLGGTAEDYATDVKVDASGSIYLVGTSRSRISGGVNILVAKLPSDGGMLGSYDGWTYQTGTLTENTPALANSASSLSQPTLGYSSYTSALTDAVATFKPYLWALCFNGVSSSSSVGSVDISFVTVYIDAYAVPSGVVGTTATGNEGTAQGLDVLPANAWVAVTPATDTNSVNRPQVGFASGAVDAAGNIYAVGYGSPGTDSTHNGFVAKFSSAGELLWQLSLNRIALSAASYLAQGAAIGSDGSLYIYGLLSNTGSALVKVSPSGSVLWVRALDANPGGGFTNAGGVAVDASNNVYVTTNAFVSSSAHIFIAKYNSNGVLQWQRRLGASVRFTGYGIATDISGNVYVVGDGDISPNSTQIVVAKYNTNGVLQWQRQLGGIGVDQGRGIAVDASGNVYITGQANISPNGNQLITAKYDTNGGLLWQRQLGGTGTVADQGRGIAVDFSGNVYVAGVVRNAEASIAKYDNNGVFQWIRTIRFSSGFPTNVFANWVGLNLTNDTMYVALAGLSNVRGAVVALPTDGTLTGTYSSVTPALTYATPPAVTSSTSTLTDSASTLVDAATTFASVNFNPLAIFNSPLLAFYSQRLAYSGVVSSGSAGTAYADTDSSRAVLVTGVSGQSALGSLLAQINISVSATGFQATSALGVELVSDSSQEYAFPSAVTATTATGAVTVSCSASVGPEPYWAVRSSIASTAVAYDTSGNVYITGQAVVSPNGNQLITAKYNTNGVLQWQRQLGNADTDIGYGVAVDASGNVYITGQANISPNGNQVITAKYDTNGVLQWQRQLGGTGTDIGRAIAVDSSGNVYITGVGFTSRDEIVTAKYDTNGVLQWQRRLVDEYIAVGDIGLGVAVDASGNVYITGTADLTIDGTSYQIITAKYNTNGVLQWQRRLGGLGQDRGFGIAVDSSGNAYITGLGVINPSGAQIFTAKYNTNGVLQWQRQLGGTGTDQGLGIAVDTSGNVYIAASALVDVGTRCIIAKYDTNGALQWQRVVSGRGFEITNGRGIAVDPFNNLYVVNETNNDLVFNLLKYPALDAPTGTYDSLVVSASALTDSAATFTDSSAILTNAAATFTDSASALVDAPATFTSTLVPMSPLLGVQSVATVSTSSLLFGTSYTGAVGTAVEALLGTSGIMGDANTGATGLQANGFLSVPSISIGALINALGVNAAGFLGATSPVGTANVLSAGVQAALAQGAVLVATTADAVIFAAGNTATGGTGAVQAVGTAQVVLFGLASPGRIGTVTTSAGAFVNPTGVNGVAFPGTVTAAAGAGVSLVGVVGVAQAGTPQILINVQAFLSGLAAGGSLGNAIVQLSGLAYVNGVQVTAVVGFANVWGLVNDAQNPVWVVVPDGQTVTWQPVTPTQTPSWGPTDTSQADSWSDVDDSSPTSWS